MYVFSLFNGWSNILEQYKRPGGYKLQNDPKFKYVSPSMNLSESINQWMNLSESEQSNNQSINRIQQLVVLFFTSSVVTQSKSCMDTKPALVQGPGLHIFTGNREDLPSIDLFMTYSFRKLRSPYFSHRRHGGLSTWAWPTMSCHVTPSASGGRWDPKLPHDQSFSVPHLLKWSAPMTRFGRMPIIGSSKPWSSSPRYKDC